MRKVKVFRLFLAGSAGALSSASALAQTTGEHAAVSDEEIIVTATRVETTLSKTPVAVTALNNETLATKGIQSAADLDRAAPGLAVNRFGQGLQYTIRGVTSQDLTEKGDPSAAFLLDGVYIPRAQATGAAFFDLTRVEVLRGPQGTLFGRNATAGVINVIARRPTPQFEAGMNATVGNFGTYSGDFFASGPVSDTLMARFAVAYQQQGSFLIDNPASAFKIPPVRKDISFRMQTLWKPSSRFSLLLRGDYSYMAGHNFTLQDESSIHRFNNPPIAFNFVPVIGPGGTPVGFTPDRPAPLPVNGPAEYFDNSSRERRQSNTLLPIRPENANTYWGAMAESTLDLGPVTFTYLGSHRELTRNENFVNKIGPAPTPNRTLSRNIEDSHELRVATNSLGRLFIQAGAYYFRERGNFSNYSYDNAISSGTPFSINRIFGGLLPGITTFGFNYPTIGARNYSFFGQAVYSITPTLRLTAGARYSNDTKTRVGGATYQRGVNFAPGDIFAPYSSSQENSKLTWRAGLDWDANDTTLIYAAVATGYKAGGINDGCLAGSTVNGVTCNDPQVARPAELLTYRPETITSYEGGIKARFFDHRLSLNLAAYHYDYRDLQLLIAAPVGGGVSVAFYGNAPKAKVDGVELEGSAQITDTTKFDFDATFTNARYTDYSPFPGFKFDGKALDRAPRFALGGTLSQDVPLGGNQRLRFSIGTRWSDEYFLSAFGVGFQVRQKPFTKSDASITFADTGKKLVIQAFVRNIEDYVEANFYLQGAGYVPGPAPTATNPFGGAYSYLDTGQVGLGAPRTFGLRASVAF